MEEKEYTFLKDDIYFRLKEMEYRREKRLIPGGTSSGQNSFKRNDQFKFIVIGDTPKTVRI